MLGLIYHNSKKRWFIRRLHYNRQRSHSFLGYVSPAQFEEKVA
ncbi:hypothetical protein LEP1GSC188_1740 [Leptospira weilii serovar Topaz str. LT2116]|uniref:Integrase core domain protein n=1 Tax=Leptospira weilii serovar Topaz str. LT2116 TaxID=1088540 RepID=M3EGE4_9LEPT|nr:hypothetical protein LEP1GSC188_1740 [Leptospira weilii serovar Topaz str. LT2116]